MADLPVGVTIQGVDTTFQYGNRAAWRLIGVPEDALVGHGLRDGGWDIVHEDGRPFELEELPACRVLATGEPVREAILGNHDPVSGGRRWLIVNASPLRDRAGKLTGSSPPSATSPRDMRRTTRRAASKRSWRLSTRPPSS